MPTTSPAPAAFAPSPWAWRPDRSAWFDACAERVRAWAPHESLGLAGGELRSRLEAAAAAREDWLVHPCLAGVTSDLPGDAVQRDLNVATWAAVNTPGGGLGTLDVPEGRAVWTRGGDLELEPGRHELDAIAATMRSQPRPPSSLAVDIWSRSVGCPIPGSWAERPADDDAGRRELLEDVRQLLRTVAIADRTLAGCSEWIGHVTKVVVPLRGAPDGAFRSGCEDDILGMVYVDVTPSDLQIMEGIVHESAHRHLFMALAQEPLVDPGHTGRYTSPLRPDPRPLRGILLAYHALAYITALYADAARARTVPSAILATEWEATAPKLDGAEETLAGARAHLTEWGREFFDRTREVASHGRA